MTKLNLLIILSAFFIGLTACEQQTPEPLSNLDFKTGERLLAGFNPLLGTDEQKIAFAALSAEEKNLVWQTKFSNLGKSTELNATQHDLISQLEAVFKPEIFVRNSAEHEVAKHQIAAWLDRAKDEFSPLELHNLFYLVRSLSPEEVALQAERNQAVNRNARLSMCECDMDSRYACGRIVGLYAMQYGRCYPDIGDCDQGSGIGCGFAFLWTCDGGRCEFDRKPGEGEGTGG